MSASATDLDDLLEEVGRFGPFQLWQCTVLLLPVVFNAFSNLCYVFTAGDLHYRCHIGQCENGTANEPYSPPWLTAAVPFRDSSGTSVPAKCERYQALGSRDEPEGFVCDAHHFNRSAIERCSELVYEDPTERTIVNDFQLTCDENRWKVTLVGTVHNIGQVVALVLSGIVSDRFGRRLTLLLSVGVGSLLGVARSFTTGYGSFMALEFLEPIFGSTSYTTAFVLSQELVEPRLRVIVKSTALVTYALAEAALGVLAMQFRNWRTLSLAVFVPGLLSIPLLWTTVESLRWLLTKGRHRAAVRILRRAAKANGRPPPSERLLERLAHQDDREAKTEQRKSFLQLLAETCHHRRLMLRIVNCSFCWFTNAMVYYGLTLNSVTLAGDKYGNFILITLAAVPPALAINCILNRFGRRKTQCASLILSGLFCLLTLTALKDITWVNVSLFLLSKMAISLSFSTLYIYTAEIFPTNLRQSFISFCSMVGRFGSMVAPQMPLLQTMWAPLPMVLFGTVAVLSGLLILEFPETTGRTLPDTLEDAIQLHKPTPAKSVEETQLDNSPETRGMKLEPR
ncbi:organic cation transporter protein-like [Anopheles bellator]|uniref:organic cation transporter protein-like n=1 Tax=Anopheles bellator TaxID=139047 RepID=UPI002649945A|nr:organic cation transporter protein-like [Anopheles bellator]